MTVIGRGCAQNLDWILPGSGVIWGSGFFFFMLQVKLVENVGLMYFLMTKMPVISGPCITGNVSVRGLCYSGRDIRFFLYVHFSLLAKL